VKISRRSFIAGSVAGATTALGTSLGPVGPAGAATSALIGGVAADWTWFDANVGPVQVYRDYDIGGFHYPTWQETAAYRRHPTAQANDYSFEIPPTQLVDPSTGWQTKVAAFLATTPRNITVTNFHEPDDPSRYGGTFTPAQYRAAIVVLAGLVRAQNALDGGTRRTSVILMNITFGTYGRFVATDFWPTDTRDGGHADIISVDAYALPHATNTAGVPIGYTDGVSWRKPAGLLTNVYTFVSQRSIPWSISELGYLEDVHDPWHKANTIRDVVTWAGARGAKHVSYFDGKGPRADWRLRYDQPPIPSTSATSKAATMWRSLAAAGVTS
jgi:hypothetical protein